jgi:phage terminase large subunit GpA-like protein
MSRPQPDTLRAILAAVIAGVAPLRAVAPMRLSEWAAKHFKLSAEASHVSGQWRAYPFQIGWMDAFSNDDIEEVTVRKAKRVGYTKTLLAFIAYNAAHRRRKQALWQPTDDDRDSFVKTEVEPMLRDVEAMRPVLVPGKEDTIKLKTFLGSVLHLLGGKAAARSDASRSRWRWSMRLTRSTRKSKSPSTRWRLRRGASRARRSRSSSPDPRCASTASATSSTAKNRPMPSCATASLARTARRRTRCCGAARKSRTASSGTAPTRPRCATCARTAARQHHAGRVPAHLGPGAAWVSECGRWRYDHHVGVWLDATAAVCSAPRHVAFVDVWTAYSPQREWVDIVREFLAAKTKADSGETGPLETFINETLAQYWKVEMDQADEHALAKRAEGYKLRTVPQGGVVLVAGVDVQDNRWELVVWAIGRGEEMWAVDYAVIYGNPADEREWEEKLEPYLFETQFEHASGQQLKHRSGSAIDTQGHFTHQAYNFCRTRERQRVFAVRGDPQPSKMVKGKATIQDVNWRGKVLKRGVRLWYVGTDTAKDLIYGRLKVTQPGPGLRALRARPAGGVLQPADRRGAHAGAHSARRRIPLGEPEARAQRSAGLHGVRDFLHAPARAAPLHGPMWKRLESALEPDLFSRK